MPRVLDLQLAGEPMQVFADRALYWPARRRLLIADLHLGKGSIFRSAGIPVPSGGTRHDLARLEVLIAEANASELWILGDFLHGARHPDAEREWSRFLASHPALSVGVVAGNHDFALATSELGIALLPEDLCEGPFRFRHHPISIATPGGAHVLCGHLHPVVRLSTFPGRYPAFRMDGNQTILPAFSAFTGGSLIDNRGRWIACIQGETLAQIW